MSNSIKSNFPNRVGQVWMYHGHEVVLIMDTIIDANSLSSTHSAVVLSGKYPRLHQFSLGEYTKSLWEYVSPALLYRIA